MSLDISALTSQPLTLPWPRPHRREVGQLLEGTDVQLMLQGRGVEVHRDAVGTGYRTATHAYPWGLPPTPMHLV